MQEKIAQQIEELPTLNRVQLTALWAQKFGKEPPQTLRKGLLVQILAYRVQEREFGGLSHGSRRRLREIAASLGSERVVPKRDDSAPQTGAKLIRIWHGESHEVRFTDDGYEYRGNSYGSLSSIAREITGTRWSGPLFFGVKKR